MSKRICSGLVIILVVMSLMAFAVVPILALDIRSEENVRVASGEVVHGDLFARSNIITIDGTVNGNLWAIAETVTVNGLVKGNIIAAGKTININGNVNGNLRLAALSLNIGSTANIKGNLLFVAGITSIDSPIGGGTTTGTMAMTSNRAGDDIELKAMGLTIFPVAEIQRDLSYITGQGADTESRFQLVSVTIDKLPPAKTEPAKALPFALFFGALGWVTSFLMAFITGLVIILLVPRRLTLVAESIRTNPWPSLGWGAVILFVTPIAAILACCTIIGIPVGLITLGLYAAAIYLAQIPVGLFVGRWIIGYFGDVEGKGIMIGALALGLVIMHLLRLIPYFGFFVGLVIILFGLGALVVSEKKRRAEAREAAST
jgi:hypothetical protein